MRQVSSVKVICITTNKIFDSAKVGAEFYGITGTHITKCCKGKLKSSGKFNGTKLLWKYYDEYLKQKTC